MLNVYSYSEWYKGKSDDEESISTIQGDVKLFMTPLESDEEDVKEGKGIKILTPKKLLTRLQILLAQVKTRNNSNKQTNKNLCNNLIRSL